MLPDVSPGAWDFGRGGRLSGTERTPRWRGSHCLLRVVLLVMLAGIQQGSVGRDAAMECWLRYS